MKGFIVVDDRVFFRIFLSHYYHVAARYTTYCCRGITIMLVVGSVTRDRRTVVYHHVLYVPESCTASSHSTMYVYGRVCTNW